MNKHALKATPVEEGSGETSLGYDKNESSVEEDVEPHPRSSRQIGGWRSPCLLQRHVESFKITQGKRLGYFN